MCFFLCLSIPNSKLPNIDWQPCNLSLENITHTPIGQAVLGNKPKGSSYLVIENGCSCAFVGKTHGKSTNDYLAFLRLVKSLLLQIPSVSILLHNTHGEVRNETITQKGKIVIALHQIEGNLMNIEEDTRYIVKLI